VNGVAICSFARRARGQAGRRRRREPLIVCLRATDFDALAIGLRGAAPALDLLAGQLLERWLSLVSRVAALSSPLEAAV
jgi:hypothetical protein